MSTFFENNLRSRIKTTIVDYILQHDVTFSKDIVIKILNEEWDKVDKRMYAYEQLERQLNCLQDCKEQITEHLRWQEENKETIKSIEAKIPVLKKIQADYIYN